LNSFLFNFSELVYLSKLFFTYFKCLCFPHSSTLEFGGGHAVKHSPVATGGFAGLSPPKLKHETL